MCWLKQNKFPFLLFSIAWLVRLIPVLLTRSLGIGLDDMFQYDMLARSLAGGNGFRWYALADLELIRKFVPLDLGSLAYEPQGVLTSFRAPLYPLFLALIYSISGVGEGRFFAARLAQSFLAAFLPLLTWLLGHHLFDESIARRAAWIVAFYPLLIAFPLALATENLFFLLVLLSILLLVRLSRRPSWSGAVLLGLSFGLAALTRSVILVMAGAALLWLVIEQRLYRHALLATFPLFLLLIPWVVRNSLLHRRLVGIETSLGYNLYVGYHPKSDGSFTFGPSLDLLVIVDDAQRDRIGTQKAVEFIRRAPLRAAYLIVRRIGHFFAPEWRAFTYFYTNGVLGPLPSPLLVLIYLLLSLPWMGLAIGAIWGWAFLPEQSPQRLVAYLFIGYLLPHILILAEERFHLTLLPLFSLLAVRFWTRSRAPQPEAGHGALSFAAIFTLFLMVYWAERIVTFWPLFLQILSPAGHLLNLPY
ncbi:MAG: glycosyltransferase family 39 protein [Anaerolineales bacterium]